MAELKLEQKQEQEQTKAQAKPTQFQSQSIPSAADAVPVRGQKMNLDDLEPAHDPQPALLLEISFCFFSLRP